MSAWLLGVIVWISSAPKTDTELVASRCVRSVRVAVTMAPSICITSSRSVKFCVTVRPSATLISTVCGA